MFAVRPTNPKSIAIADAEALATGMRTPDAAALLTGGLSLSYSIGAPDGESRALAVRDSADLEDEEPRQALLSWEAVHEVGEGGEGGETEEGEGEADEVHASSGYTSQQPGGGGDDDHDHDGGGGDRQTDEVYPL